MDDPKAVPKCPSLRDKCRHHLKISAKKDNAAAVQRSLLETLRTGQEGDRDFKDSHRDLVGLSASRVS